MVGLCITLFAFCLSGCSQEKSTEEQLEEYNALESIDDFINEINDDISIMFSYAANGTGDDVTAMAKAESNIDVLCDAVMPATA